MDMRFGAMNNPMCDVVEEIDSFAEMGFDFVDLTLEPEQTYSARIDVGKVAGALERAGLSAVGHTAWYLPIASPFPEFRELEGAEGPGSQQDERPSAPAGIAAR
jgi:sugar phosphate isomerase/epimerase